MIKDIVKDTEFLSQKSEKFDIEVDGKSLLKDMLDTANFHKENCAGLAATQIGVLKRVILVRHGMKFIPYINPKIIWKSPQTYMATEGCLSLEGLRNVKRHKTIKLIYSDTNGKMFCKIINGRQAQIIQHECDHLEGILI